MSPASLDRREVAVEPGDDIEREVLQFEPDIEDDQIVGRDHHHHADRRQHDQNRKFEAVGAVLFVIAPAHQDRHRGADQHERFHEDAETVADEHPEIPEMGPGSGGLHDDKHDNERRDRQPRDQSSRAVSPHDANYQQHHRQAGEDNLRQGRRQLGNRHRRHGATSGRLARRSPAASVAAVTRCTRWSTVAWIGRRNEFG